MGFLDDAKKILSLAASAARGLELVGNIARGQLGTTKGGDAIAALQTIATLADVVKGGLDGKIHEDDVAKHIDDQISSLEAGLAKIDADDQTAIDKKFPSG